MGVVKRLDALTGIRALAAFWILIFHSRLSTMEQIPLPVRSFIGAGYAAVSLFFVLSGFILIYNYSQKVTAAEDRRTFWSHFMVARFARIYPLYFVGFVMGIVAFAVSGREVTGAGVISRILALQSWSPTLVHGVNMPSWSLSCEFFFYACFPLVGLWIARAKEGQLKLWFWGSTLAALLIPAGYVMATGGLWDSTAEVEAVFRFNPLLRLAEFIAGIAVGQMYLNGKSLLSWRTSPTLTFAVAVGVVVVMATMFPIEWRMILHSGGLTLPFSAAIFALAEGEGAIARWLSSRVMVYLGEISYGVYILQAPIKELMEHFAGETGGLIKPVLTLALSVIIPAIAFTLVEKPARDLILGWSKKRRLATQGS